MMPFIAGDVWRVVIHHRNASLDPIACAFTTHFIQATSDYSGAEDIALAVHDAWASMVHILSSDVVSSGCYVRRVLPDPVPETAIPFAIPLVGTQVATELPTAVSVEVLRSTGVRGKQNWGRFYLPWTTEAQRDPGNLAQIDAAAAANIESAYALFVSILNSGNSAGISAVPVILSERSAFGGVHHAPVVSWRAVRAYRSLGKRGRKTVDCPPFAPSSVQAGGMAVNSILAPWDTPTSYVLSHSRWKCKNLSLGNGAGNAAEPAGWEQPGFDDHLWTDLARPHSLAKTTLPPHTYPRTPCVPPAPDAEGIVYPPDWDNPQPPGNSWNSDVAEFHGQWWVQAGSGSVNSFTVPRDGHVLLRTTLNTDLFDGPVINGFLRLNAWDSFSVYVDGVALLDEPDTEVTYPSLPQFFRAPAGALVDPGTHTLAIRVRSKHIPNTDPCPPNTVWAHSYREWHIYSDCLIWDAFCLHTIFGHTWDQYVRGVAFLSFGLYVETLPPI